MTSWLGSVIIPLRTLDDVIFFFRHPPLKLGEADGMTQAGNYDNKNNCQEKAYAALEIIQ